MNIAVSIANLEPQLTLEFFALPSEYNQKQVKTIARYPYGLGIHAEHEQGPLGTRQPCFRDSPPASGVCSNRIGDGHLAALDDHVPVREEGACSQAV